jgi:aminoglycoside phosphotransferase (APT) family kinase protein
MTADDRAGSGRWAGPPLYSRPTVAEVEACLRACAPAFAQTPVEAFAEGWEFWAFAAGDHVFRSPKTATGEAVLAMDRRLLPELSAYLTTPIPIVEVYCERGPNAQPLAGHRRLPGVLLENEGQFLSPAFGHQVGTILSELHAFPVERALALGVPLHDGPVLKQRRIRHYGAVRERAFPLLDTEMRAAVTAAFETYLEEPANFDFEPRLIHQDLDSNLLIDPDTGSITGLIDFSATVVGKPAIDFWLPLEGFRRLGIDGQVPGCLEAAGVGEAAVAEMLPEVQFWNLRYPLLGILHGLDVGHAAYITESVAELRRALSR